MEQTIKTCTVSKWLQIMFYIGLASLISSVITMIPAVPAGLTAWANRIIMIAMVICIYQLRFENEHYKKAAVFRGIMVICSLAATFLLTSSILTLAASIFSIIGVYQEYSGHASLIGDRDPRLAGKWNSLFYWGLAVGILISFGTTTAAVVIVVEEMPVDSAVTWIMAALMVPQMVVDIVYLGYLRKMIFLLREKDQDICSL